MTLLKKILGTAIAFSKEKQRPNETLSSQISLINIPASMREFKAKPIILRIIESDPSKCHSSYIFESNRNNHQCEKPKTSREMKESMLERERERERERGVYHPWWWHRRGKHGWWWEFHCLGSPPVTKHGRRF